MTKNKKWYNIKTTKVEGGDLMIIEIPKGYTFEKEGDLIFNRWYADMAKRGVPIEWEDMI